jgi:orotidine-5'-phosphate decarboxylase
MNRQKLVDQIRRKKSYLCVGLDTDLDKIPKHLLKSKDPVFEFNKQIIDATYKYSVAYKPNVAFYEARGAAGWESLQKTVEYIPEDIFTIADAKRGDLGNTATQYAKTFFELLNFDAITLAPYMGKDSIQPFLDFKDKWVILLAHTSNAGSGDFQTQELKTGRKLYEEVMIQAQQWATPEQMMFVVGATRADKMEEIRYLAPDSFFLVPGIGAQGGDLELVSKAGLNNECGLLVNSSRAIIYASDKPDFAYAAGVEAKLVQQQMEFLLADFS